MLPWKCTKSRSRIFFWVGSYANLDASQGTTLASKRAYWIHAWERSELDYFPISIGE